MVKKIKTKPVKNFAIMFAVLTVAVYSFSCMEKKDTVMTVNGWIDAEEMGVTLPHEHIMVDWIGADSTGYHRWDKDSVVSRVLPYMKEVSSYGCRTFIDCTPAYLGRDPVADRKLSELTGLNIIISTGYYGAGNNKYLPQHAWSETAEELAGRWLKEWGNGIEETGIRPGIIKIGIRRDTTLSDLHQKIVRAAALTHLKSGLTVVSHTGPADRAFEQLEILAREGVSPEAFVWTHAQGASPDEHIRAARMGCWVSFDKVNADPENITGCIALLHNMKEHGCLDKVLVSHDAGWYNVGQPGGGNFRPYHAIFTHLIPAMKEAGFTDDDISMIMIKNPREAYAVKTRRM